MQGDVLEKIIYFAGGVTKYCSSVVIIGVVASAMSSLLYKRGSTAATMTLLGYCMPFMTICAAMAFIITVLVNGPSYMPVIIVIIPIFYFIGLNCAAIQYANNLSAVASAQLFLLGMGAELGLFKVVAIALNSVGVDISASFIPIGF